MNFVSMCGALIIWLGAANCVGGCSIMPFLAPGTDNYALFQSIAGNGMAEFRRTGEPAEDEVERHRFADAAGQCELKTDAGAPERRRLTGGVNSDSGWHFDDGDAVEDTTHSTHRNEIAVVELCRRFREAEFTYFEMEATFARKIRSTPGKHDGLVWSGKGEEDESPMGPVFAAAAFAEQQPNETPQPLFGYYFKILRARLAYSQGRALDCGDNCRRSDGVEFVAWPAEYRVDGLLTFVIDHLGNVYQKDLGPDTVRMVESMTAFIPDHSWHQVDGE
jgi:hypothetical protein